MLAVELLCLSFMTIVSTPNSDDKTMTLEDATAMALAHANDMIQAREDVLMLDADYATALSAIMPRIDVSMAAGAFYSRNLIIETRNAGANEGDDGDPVVMPNEPPAVRFGPFVDFDSNSYGNPTMSLGLSANQLIFDGGRWWTVIAQADDRRAATKADLEAIKNVVKARVAQNFFGLERAQQAKRAIEAQVGVDRAQVERAEALLRVGRGAPADVATARRNLASDQIQLLAARTTVGQARRTFNLQLGRSPKKEVVLVMPPQVASSTVVERFVPELGQLLTFARRYRPDLERERAALAAAEKEVTIARSAYWPTFNLRAQYNRNSRRPDRIFANPLENYTATVDVAMQWNLFEGFATNAAVERAQVGFRKQKATYREQERQVFSQVEDGLQRYQNQQEATRFAQAQFDAAQEAVRLARGLYEAGRGTSLELRDAELGLTQARIAIINARLDAAIAFADLVQAVGTDDWAVQQTP